MEINNRNLNLAPYLVRNKKTLKKVHYKLILK